MLKVGDKVKVKTFEELSKNAKDVLGDNKLFFGFSIPYLTSEMQRFCGKEVTIAACLGNRLYWIEEDNHSHTWHEMFFESPEVLAEELDEGVKKVLKDIVDRSDVCIKSFAGVKHDEGKARFDLIPPEPLWELARLYTKGAEKYGDRNWEKGMRWGKVFAAMMRHAWKWWQGEEYDPEDGQHHLVSVAWCAFALYTYYVRGVGEDDRVKSRKNCPVYEQSNFITHTWADCPGVFSIPDYEAGDLKCNECGASLRGEIENFVSSLRYRG